MKINSINLISQDLNETKKLINNDFPQARSKEKNLSLDKDLLSIKNLQQNYHYNLPIIIDSSNLMNDNENNIVGNLDILTQIQKLKTDNIQYQLNQYIKNNYENLKTNLQQNIFHNVL